MNYPDEFWQEIGDQINTVQTKPTWTDDQQWLTGSVRQRLKYPDEFNQEMGIKSYTWLASSESLRYTQPLENGSDRENGDPVAYLCFFDFVGFEVVATADWFGAVTRDERRAAGLAGAATRWLSTILVRYNLPQL